MTLCIWDSGSKAQIKNRAVAPASPKKAIFKRVTGRVENSTARDVSSNLTAPYILASGGTM
jgi:hypothetical protein